MTLPPEPHPVEPEVRSGPMVSPLVLATVALVVAIVALILALAAL